jgi:hypothetical protein
MTKFKFILVLFYTTKGTITYASDGKSLLDRFESVVKPIFSIANTELWEGSTRHHLFGKISTELDFDDDMNPFDAELNERYMVPLRKPKSKFLLLGCGNISPYQIGSGVDEIDNIGSDYRDIHSHEGFDTIDADFAKNPSLIAAIPIFDSEKSSVFDERFFEKYPIENRYEAIYLEGLISPTSKEISSKQAKFLLRLLAKNGKIFQTSHISGEEEITSHVLLCAE